MAMLWQSFSHSAKETVIAAQEAAAANGELYVRPEHLLIGLVRDPDTVASKVLKSMGVSPASLRTETESALGERKRKRVPTGDVTLDPRMKRVLNLTYDEARKAKCNYIGTEHLLLGMLREEDGSAFQLLKQKGLDVPRVREEIRAYLGAKSDGSPDAAESRDHRARTCEEVRDQLVALALGELDGERQREVEEHLARCESCSQELASARQVMAVTQLADDSSIVETVNRMIHSSIECGASDIHIEMDNSGPRFRIRVDGALRPYVSETPIQPEHYRAIIARIKMMAECHVAETQVPQDGRIRVVNRAVDREFDLRVSFLPHIHGEDAVIRILDLRSLPDLNWIMQYAPEDLQKVEELISRPNGLILCTGPTLSGKTTLLYALLDRIKSPEVKILSVEDPVEYDLPGITQVNVSRRIDLTFPAAIRTVMRQDPDVLMVGEQSDLETLELTIEAAQTGHLVLTTLHTQDAASAFTRMIDIGLEPYLVSSSVIGVIGQRLARKVCPHCREECPAPREALEMLGYRGEGEPPLLARGRGCEECRGTGLRGRAPVQEVLVVSPEVQDLVARRAPTDEIRYAARANGMKTMKESALDLVLKGVIPLSEALRVLSTHRWPSG